MKAYNIALALFVLNTVIASINGMGIFDTHVFEAPKPMDEVTITEKVTDFESLHSYEWIFFAPIILVEMFALLFVAISNAIMLNIPMMTHYGVPTGVIAMISGPIAIVYSWGAIQFLTGKSGKSIE